MIKKLSIIIAIVVCSVFALPILATGTPLVNDEAGLFTEQELASLQTYATEISLSYDENVAILTVETVGGNSAGLYAENYFLEQNIGQGDDESGILFMITMQEREFIIRTRGDSVDTFSTAGQEYITDKMLSDLSDGNYYDAFNTYLTQAELFLEKASTGNAYDAHDLLTSDERLMRVAIGFLIGLLSAGLVCYIFYSQLKSVSPVRNAHNYVSRGLHLTRERDLYLYSRTTRVALPKNDSNSGGGRPSGGFGGSGGKF